MSSARREQSGLLLRLVTLASIGVALAGLGHRDWWLCDLLANLRVHSVAAMLLLLPLQLGSGRPRLATATTAAVALAIAVSVGPVTNATRGDGLERPAGLTVVSYNLGPVFRNADAVIDYFRAEPGDVLVLQEYTPPWHESLRTLRRLYPHVITEPRDGPFGIAVMSRLPLSDTVIHAFTGRQIPLIATTVDVPGRRIHLLGLHLEWPMLPAAFAVRNEQLSEVVDLIAGAEAPLLVCGDWNMTPWSGSYRRLLASGVHDGGWRARVKPTWPSALSLLGIPIDHCVASPDVDIATRQIGPALGSDHRPVVVRTRHDASAA